LRPPIASLDPQAGGAMIESADFLEHKMATIADAAELHKTLR
jgi:hypothetical protein